MMSLCNLKVFLVVCFFCSCRLGGPQTDASNSGVDLVYRVRRSLAQNRRRASPTQSPKSCKASRVVRNYSGPRQDLYSKRLIVMHASRLGQGKHGPSSIFCRRGEVTVTDWSWASWHQIKGNVRWCRHHRWIWRAGCFGGIHLSDLVETRVVWVDRFSCWDCASQLGLWACNL